MLHLKNTGFGPSDTGRLLQNARHLAGGFDAIIRDCRVATKYVEFDVSIDQSYLDALVEKFQSIAPLDHAKKHPERGDGIPVSSGSAAWRLP